MCLNMKGSHTKHCHYVNDFNLGKCKLFQNVHFLCCIYLFFPTMYKLKNSTVVAGANNYIPLLSHTGSKKQ